MKIATTILCIILLIEAIRVVWADNAWIRKRPGNDVDVSGMIENNWSDGNASVGVGVDVLDYEKDDPRWGPGGPDTFVLGVSAVADALLYAIGMEPSI